MRRWGEWEKLKISLVTFLRGHELWLSAQNSNNFKFLAPQLTGKSVRPGQPIRDSLCHADRLRSSVKLSTDKIKFFQWPQKFAYPAQIFNSGKFEKVCLKFRLAHYVWRRLNIWQATLPFKNILKIYISLKMTVILM